MTLYGAIKQLHELRAAEGMPIYYKPAIVEVINVLLMDAQEVRHGRWITVENDIDYYPFMCSECYETVTKKTKFCPNCGAKMVNRDG